MQVVLWILGIALVVGLLIAVTIWMLMLGAAIDNAIGVPTQQQQQQQQHSSAQMAAMYAMLNPDEFPDVPF